MPDSRRRRVWFLTLVALVALLAFTPQAGAMEYEDDPDAPVGCVAGDYEHEDDCSSEEPKEEPAPDEPKEEPAPDDGTDEPKQTESCGDEPTARAANGSHEGEETQFQDGCLPQVVRGFLNRVWKFVGEVDYYEVGELSMTLGRILNVPRRLRSEDDELLDQDTTVLVGLRARVFKDGTRVAREELDNANDVRVHGKLLRPRMWRPDEDGTPVPTIRAKKVYITG